MTDNPLNQNRVLNEKVRATLRRLEEAEARTRELRAEVERLNAEHQRLLEQLREQNESPHSSPPPPSRHSSKLDT